jgi:hypothetical protein
MTEQGRHQHIDIRDGDRAVASADIITPEDGEGPARAALHAEAGHIPPGSRARLVDAVLDLPDVQGSQHLQASVPLGDAESLHRLHDRCPDVTTKAAGSTALVDAELPPRRQADESPREPVDQTPPPDDVPRP